MGVYPIMYILFDTGRLLDGIQDLRPYELPHHTEGGYTWHVFHRRHYTFTDSADDFRQALAWMRGDRQPPLYDGAEPEPNVFSFTLGDPRDDDSRVDFEFLDDHQMLLPVNATSSPRSASTARRTSASSPPSIPRGPSSAPSSR